MPVAINTAVVVDRLVVPLVAAKSTATPCLSKSPAAHATRNEKLESVCIQGTENRRCGATATLLYCSTAAARRPHHNTQQYFEVDKNDIAGQCTQAMMLPHANQMGRLSEDVFLSTAASSLSAVVSSRDRDQALEPWTSIHAGRRTCASVLVWTRSLNNNNLMRQSRRIVLPSRVAYPTRSGLQFPLL